MKSPGNDVFFILLHYGTSFKQITALCNTKTGSKKRLLNITILAQSLSQAQSTALMSVHTFSGCDTRSLKGNGKMKPLKTFQKYPE